jgi:hypothetical protein
MSELSDLARPSVNNAPSSTEVAVEMDRMDRILAAHAPPPPPPQKAAEERENSTSPGHSPSSTINSNGESPDSTKSSPSNSENGGEEQIGTEVCRKINCVSGNKGEQEKLPVGNVFKGQSFFPHSASPKPKHPRENYNDVYPDDVTPHKVSHESDLPSVSDEDEEPENTSTVAETSHAREVANKKLSSIDAFEASFDTAFPVVFTSPKEGKSETLVTSEIYNPFFSSPAKKKAMQDAAEKGDAERGRKSWGTSLRERSPVVRKSPASRAYEQVPEGMPKIASSGRQPTIEDVDEDRSIIDPASTPSPKSPDPKSQEPDVESALKLPDPSSSPKIISRASTAGVYSTPPQFHRTSPEKPAVVPEPRRPEKTVSASARARYERALQPRIYTSRMKDPSLDGSSIPVDTSTDSADASRNSPSTVLRRLQQRRVKTEKTEQRFQTTPDRGTSENSTTTPARSLRHPPFPNDDSPFDEDVGAARINDGATRRSFTTNSNGSMSWRNSQNDAEDQERSRSLSNHVSKKLSPNSMNAEIRALDAMASGSYLQRGNESSSGSDDSPEKGGAASRYNAALKQRRSVKQPVSYAEPPLNTKVRRGDVYFPKEEDNLTKTPVVSPTGSSDDSGHRASGTRSGASPDEVLKDLSGPAAVQS